MRASTRFFQTAFALIMFTAGSSVSPVCGATPDAESDGALASDDAASRGRELFEHEWTPGDALSPNGDGLGPMHNAKSCAACHRHGGMGGGGPGENDVELLTLVDDKPIRGGQLKPLHEIHPAFFGRNPPRTIVLHRFGTDPDYERWRLLLLGETMPDGVTGRAARALRRQIAKRKADQSVVKQLPEYEGRQFVVTRRNTPSLFGAALIDSIPETALRDVAREQNQVGTPVSGRVAPVPGGDVGRFGWRGQTSTLRAFILGACANELGLEVRGERQAADPFDPTHRPDGFDLSVEQCEELVSFVESLPPPGRNIPASKYLQVKQGEVVFERIGCAECHRVNLGQVEGLYSDLLLHDMGAQLSDPLPAQPDILPPGALLKTGYYSAVVLTEFTPVTAGIRREWRTPPLWGVADSAPYLHDGRAKTLEAAILAHGGEAETSVYNFRTQLPSDRAALLAFLNSLSSGVRSIVETK